MDRAGLDEVTVGSELVVRDSLLPLFLEKRLGRVFLRYGVTATRDRKRVSPLSPLVSIAPRVPPAEPRGLVGDGGGRARLPRLAPAGGDARRDDARDGRGLRRLPARRGRGGVRRAGSGSSSARRTSTRRSRPAGSSSTPSGPRRRPISRRSSAPRPTRSWPTRATSSRPPRPRGCSSSRRRTGTGSSGTRSSRATSPGTASSRGTARESGAASPTA